MPSSVLEPREEVYNTHKQCILQPPDSNVEDIVCKLYPKWLIGNKKSIWPARKVTVSDESHFVEFGVQGKGDCAQAEMGTYVDHKCPCLPGLLPPLLP